MGHMVYRKYTVYQHDAKKVGQVAVIAMRQISMQTSLSKGRLISTFIIYFFNLKIIIHSYYNINKNNMSIHKS